MTNKNGEFQIEVLADGKFKVTAPGAFSPQVHASADELLDLIVKLSGGEIVEQKSLGGHTHHHHGLGSHTHGHGDTTHKH